MKHKIMCATYIICILFAQLLSYALGVWFEVRAVNNFGQTSSCMDIVIPKDWGGEPNDLEVLFSDISDQYSISVVKSTAELSGTKDITVFSGVYDWDTFPFRLVLSQGRLPIGIDECAATLPSPGRLQVGTLASLGETCPVIIQSLHYYWSTGGEVVGQYRLTSNHSYDRDEVLSRISDDTGISVDRLVSVRPSSVLSGGPLLPLAVILCLAAFVAHFLVLAAFPALKSRDIGNLKALGWTNWEIWLHLNGVPLCLGLAVGIISVLLQIGFLPGFNENYFALLLAGTTVALLIATLLSFTAILMIGKIDIPSLSSGSVSFRPVLISGLFIKVALSFVMFGFLYATVPLVGELLALLSGQDDLHSSWNMSVIADYRLTSEDMDLLSSNSGDLGSKFSELYDVLSTEFSGEYCVDSSDEEAFRMTVNTNYLMNHPLYDEHGRKIIIPDNEVSRVVLIPLERKGQLDAILGQELSFADDVLKSSASKYGEICDSIRVNYLFYQRGYDQPAWKNGEMDDFGSSAPIYHVVTERNISTLEKSRLQLKALDSPMRFHLTEKEARSMEKKLSQMQGFEGNHIKIGKVSEVVGDQITAKFTSLGVVGVVTSIIFVFCFASSLLISSVLFVSEGKRNCVKRLLGWGKLERLGSTFAFLVIVDAVIIAIAAQSDRGALLAGALLLSFVPDLLLYQAAFSLCERRALPMLLKGDL